MDALQLQAEFFRALANPVRLCILYALKDRNSCVCDLVALTGEDQPAVSRHLGELKDAGILEAQKQGKKVCYRIKDKNIIKILDISKDIIRGRGEKIISALAEGEK
ncbi:MAG: metalloregulator ArsR/SmtB family transcription factor [Spirochaetia bacterium]|nr:metalloregulator ArsR/SmtB family transcription factor [Spirochaetia bacterium]